jgi:hypothetical protein
MDQGLRLLTAGGRLPLPAVLPKQLATAAQWWTVADLRVYG